jgi:hypothetical protein
MDDDNFPMTWQNNSTMQISRETGRESQESPKVRRLFMVLSPRSLPYARLALESLYRNCDDPFSLCLITDSQDDVVRLTSELDSLKSQPKLAWQSSSIYGEAELADRAKEKFGRLEHIDAFRRGHPCWRKITDPLLLTNDRDEMVVLDPDLYFPNRFSFEPTPSSGLLLMWQRPSCLLPPEVVEAAIDAGVAMAHHTDIGVAQWRQPVDLEWLDWLIGKIGSSRLPRSMHVESIVWAALAMRMGGGHLDPAMWVCWHRSQYKRLLRKFGTSGPAILRRESFAGVKCFHAGGEAKWWLADAYKQGILDRGEYVVSFADPKPYQRLSPSEYYALQRNRRWLRRLGYYSIFDNA